MTEQRIIRISQTKAPINFKPVDDLMKEALQEGVFPGAVLLVANNRRVIFFSAYGYANIYARRIMRCETVFDLASLTKPLATALAVLKLIEAGRLTPDQPIASIISDFGGTDKSSLSIQQLLAHTAGLPAYQPYYKRMITEPPQKRQPILRRAIVHEPMAAPAGKKGIYTDLGFMILNWIVETIAGSRLDVFVTEEIFKPLNLANLFFVETEKVTDNKKFAATEQCPWRKCLIEGVVHDDNAYAAGGIEGHAGLFGAAHDVYRLLLALLRAYHGESSGGIFDQKWVRYFFEKQEVSDRALGFDMPSSSGSSSGKYFSHQTVGHLGFTGTSFWMDLEQSMMVILFTNRVHPTRINEKIKTFRPKLHDAVWEHAGEMIG